MIILIGESGSGKSTILEKLCERGYEKAINHTTRPKRPSEKNSKEMKFVTKEEFEQLWKENKLLQRAEFNQEYYGISTESLKENVVCISIVDSVKDIKNKAKELGKEIPLVVFYIYVPEEERVRRMLKRGDSMESIQTRLEIDREKFKNAKEVADYMIENVDIQRAVEEILEKNKFNEND